MSVKFCTDQWKIKLITHHVSELAKFLIAE